MAKRVRICPDCGDKRSYSMKWDSYGCERCRKWLEEECKCGDGKDRPCPFAGRPERPSRDERWQDIP